MVELLGAFSLTHPAVAAFVAIAALVGAWQIIWKKGLKPTAKFIHNINELVDTSRDLLAVTPVLVDIAQEFKTNGGSSLRDVVNSIETKVDNAKIAVDIAQIAIGTWASDRDTVFERLANMEETQRQIITAVSSVLKSTTTTDTAIAKVLSDVAAALDPVHIVVETVQLDK